MNRTLAVMFTMTTYGTWLRGDQRNWVDDGVIMPPNPILEKNDAQRMEYAPFRFVDDDWWAIGNWIGTSLIDRMKVRIAAMTVQPWHVHFVVAATERAISDIAKCAKDAVRWGLRIKRRIGPMATTNDFASTGIRRSKTPLRCATQHRAWASGKAVGFHRNLAMKSR